MIENWAGSGMPPEEYDVLDRRIIQEPESNIKTEYIWIKGAHPYKGTVMQGFTGTETFVEIHNYPGFKPRLIKDHTNIPIEHPLFDILKRK